MKNSEVTITQMKSMIETEYEKLLSSLSDSDIRLLQRTFRGWTKQEWLDATNKLFGFVEDFIPMSPRDRMHHHPDQLERAILALMSWQACNQLWLLFEKISEIPELNSPHPELLPAHIVGSGAFAFHVIKNADMLWPSELGSPFQD